jgi:hypothetical protein
MLYERLRFDDTGVDFLPSMLKAYADRHPNARLVTGDAESYRDKGRAYDLTFSNQLVQYFDSGSSPAWSGTTFGTWYSSPRLRSSASGSA